jgi:hypothetical protein
MRAQMSVWQLQRVQITNNDRLFFVHLHRWFPSILKTMTIIQLDL